MLTDEQIEMAKKSTKYTMSKTERLHESPDSIRIAYEWLEAQNTRKKVNNKLCFTHGLKGAIEAWGGRYVSQADVEVAVTLLPHIKGQYPYYNFASRLVEPSASRLLPIQEAYCHSESYSYKHNPDMYKCKELVLSLSYVTY